MGSRLGREKIGTHKHRWTANLRAAEADRWTVKRSGGSKYIMWGSVIARVSATNENGWSLFERFFGCATEIRNDDYAKGSCAKFMEPNRPKTQLRSIELSMVWNYVNVFCAALISQLGAGFGTTPQQPLVLSILLLLQKRPHWWWNIIIRQHDRHTTPGAFVYIFMEIISSKRE